MPARPAATSNEIISYHIRAIIKYVLLIRLPFISSEIFNCEINQILDKFFDAKEVDPASDSEEEHEEAK